MTPTGHKLVTLEMLVVRSIHVNLIVQNRTLLDQRLAEHLGQTETLGVRQESIGLQQETLALHDASTARAKEGTGTTTILRTC